MKASISAMLMALLFAVSANAEVIHFNDYESSGANQGAGLGIQPDSMDFTDGGGDFAGQSGLGLSSDNPNSGSFAYVIDAGDTVDNGNGWGGNWSGISSVSGLTSGGFSSEADVLNNGFGKYINYAEGATFTASAMVATDGTDPLTGTATFAPRLEFFDAGGNELFRNGAATPLGAADLTTGYQMISHSYTLTADDVAAGVVRVSAVFGSDGHGFGNTDGLIYVDDVSFEVNDEFVVTVVPEPGSATIILASVLGLCGFRRRRS